MKLQIQKTIFLVGLIVLILLTFKFEKVFNRGDSIVSDAEITTKDPKKTLARSLATELDRTKRQLGNKTSSEVLQLVSEKAAYGLSDLITSSGFFENKGQYQEEIQFVLKRKGMKVILFQNSFGYSIPEKVTTDEGTNVINHFVEVQLMGANPHPIIVVDEEKKGVFNYFGKKEREPVLGIQHFGKVSYQNIYPGIDLELYAYKQVDKRPGIKYNFVVHPSGDPGDIRINFKGKKSMETSQLMDFDGRSLLSSAAFDLSETWFAEDRQLNIEISDHLTVSEQMHELFSISENGKTPVSGRYVLDGDEVTVAVDQYDRSKDLVIDPDVVILMPRASTYYGTEGTDRMRDVATDSNGDVFVVGQTAGDSAIIALSGAFQPAPSANEGDNDIIIAKFSGDLSELLVASYYGGSGTEDAFAIQLDDADNVYIGGYTASEDLTVPGGMHNAQGEDLLVARFNTTLSNLDWSMPIGGAANDRVNDITVRDGRVFLVGTSFSDGLQTDGTPGLDGTSDAFISALNAGNGNQQWFRYFGDAGEDEGNGITSGASGIFITGYITDQDIFNTRAFVGQFDQNGNRINDANYGINITSNDIALNPSETFLTLVGGISGGGLTNLVHQTSRSGGQDGFLITVNVSDLSVEWSTFYGGTENDELQGVAIDCNDNINAIGYSRSRNDGNVIALNGFINSFQGGGGNPEDRGDAILIKFSGEGVRQWGSYFGNTGDEEGIGITLGSEGNIIMCGATLSGEGITTEESFDPVYGDNGKQGIVGFVSTFCDVVVANGPEDQTEVPLGGNAFFTADAQSCGVVTGYQWFKDGLLLSDGGTISGTLTDSIAIEAVTFADSGMYCVQINTTCGDAIELCARLSIVVLEGNNVCLDSASVLGTPSALQDTIRLDFVDFDDNPDITNATYLWRVSSASGNVAGGNTVINGSSGPFPFDLPMTAPRADLFDIEIIPSRSDTYTYELVFEYDDARRNPTLVRDSISVVVEVFPFPTVTNNNPGTIAICEDETANISLMSDIDLSRITYERIDGNATLTGNETGEVTENLTGGNPIEIPLSGFVNSTNTPLEATFRVIAFSTQDCPGPSSVFSVDIMPNPEMEFTLSQDTICTGGDVSLQFSAATSPANFQENGGTMIDYERLANPGIAEAPSNGSNILNSGTIDETLTNTSGEIQTVTYQFTADFNGCQTSFSRSVVVLPSVELVHTGENLIEVCSNEPTSIVLSGSVSSLATTYEISFEDNSNVTGDDDLTLSSVVNGQVTFTTTLVNTTNAVESVIATITPFVLIEGGMRCEGVSEDFEFVVTPIPVVTNQEMEVCENTRLALDLATFSSGPGDLGYRWIAVNDDGNVTGFADGTGQFITDSLQLSSGTVGTVVYQVVASINGCESEVGNVTVVVRGRPEIVLSANPLPEICDTDPSPVTITAAISGIDESEVVSLQWFQDDVILTGETNSTLTVNDAGFYRIDVESVGRCFESRLIEIQGVARATVSIDAAGDSETCSDDDFILTTTVTGGVANTYQWLFNGAPLAGEINPTLLVGNPGDYQVVVNGQGACPDSSQVVSVNFFPNPDPFFNLAPEVCALDVLNLSGINQNTLATIAEVAWSVTGSGPLPTFSDPASLETELRFQENQSTDESFEVTLRLTTDNGCTEELTLPILQQPRPIVAFSFPDQNCPGTITLLNQASSGVSSYLWEVVSGGGEIVIADPADPNTSFEVLNDTENVIDFDIRLIGTSSNGCRDSMVQTLAIQPFPTMTITGDTGDLCNGQTINLSSTSSSSNNPSGFSSISWLLNGQLVSTQEVLSQSLANPGISDSTYQITLIGENAAGCADSVSVNVLVHPDARAEINTSQSQACVPFVIDDQIISLTEFPDANTENYLWEVDSAGTIVASSTGILPPTYIIDEPEISITYRLTAFSPNGCAEDVDVFTFDSFPATISRFEPSEVEVCEGEPILFNNLSTNVNTSSWDFGDGSTSNEFSPAHTFINESFVEDTTYTVTLRTSTINGCEDMTSLPVTIYPTPLASFTASGVCAGESLTVSNQSIGKGPLSYLWSTDDPSRVTIDDETAVNPAFSFADNQEGDLVFNITLRVTSVDGCMATTTQPISIASRPTAQIGFEAIQCLEVPTLFENLSTNQSLSTADSVFIWQYGDGTSDTLTTRNPVAHQYPAVGEYEVSLLAVTSAGCTDLVTQRVTIIALPTPVITKTEDPVTGCAPVVGTFGSENSTIFNAGETYFWDFGNGETSTLPTPPPITFLQNDERDTTYQISLTISNQCGSSTATESVLVRPMPVADFSIPFTFGCDDVAVDLLNESLGLPDLFIWDFGDGTVDSLTSREPFTHVFQNDGLNDTTFIITLTAINDCGVDSTTREITVVPFNDNATVAIDAPDNRFCVDEEITAIAAGLAGSQGREIDWLVNGVSFPNEDTILFSFDEPGIFEVILNVFVPVCGNSLSDTLEIVVEAGPEISFETAPTICDGELLSITNTSEIFAATTVWDFGDGTGFTGAEPPPHEYPEAGSYIIAMSLEGANGCETVRTETIEVLSAPTSNFDPMGLFCEDNTFTFVPTSLNAQSFKWKILETQDSSFNEVFTRFLDVPQVYTIELTSYSEPGQQGCFDVIQLPIVVNPNPVAAFELSRDKVCRDSVITIINQSTGAANFRWTLRDENDEVIVQQILETTDSSDFDFNVPQAGSFTIHLEAFSSAGCVIEASQPIQGIELVPSFDFTVSPFCRSLDIGLVNTGFYEDSSRVNFQWQVDTTLISEEFVPEPFTVFKDSSSSASRLVEVTLFAEDEGCEQSFTDNIEIQPFLGCSFEVPNAFRLSEVTPSIARDETWLIRINPLDTAEFTSISLKVYNENSRQLVYVMDYERVGGIGTPMIRLEGGNELTADRPTWQQNIFWDGRDLKGDLVPLGRYYYILDVRCCDAASSGLREGFIQVIGL